MSLRSLSASAASWGRMSLRLERWSDEVTRAEFDLAESDCKDRRAVCDDCANDWGSEDVMEERGSVVNRFKYFVVTLSKPLGTERGEVGVSKYGASNSYKGSAMIEERREDEVWLREPIGARNVKDTEMRCP